MVSSQLVFLVIQSNLGAAVFVHLALLAHDRILDAISVSIDTYESPSRFARYE